MPRVVLALSLALLCQCGPRLVRPDAADAAPTDALEVLPERPRPDRDGDGLCDDTEEDTTRTDPDDVDTDGDGFTDGFEFSQGLSPLSARAPDPGRILPWSESPGEPIEQAFNVYFRGNGEGVFGAFYESPPGVDGLRGEELGVRIEAIAAFPPSNAQDFAGERFVSVLGPTRLTFRVVGEWPAREPLRCRRAYVLYPSAYAEGSGLVYLRGLFLDVRATSSPRDSGATDSGATDSGATDSGAMDGGTSGPWPHARDGYCLPRPGSCR